MDLGWLKCFNWLASKGHPWLVREDQGGCPRGRIVADLLFLDGPKVSQAPPD
jgi:hypothetical protein